MNGQHVDYQTTEQCWNNALTFLQYLNSFPKIDGITQMKYMYLYVAELRGMQNIFSQGLRTTWQFTVKNDGGVNKFYLQYRENTTIKLQGVVQDLKELHRLA